jgi:uncharacterized protein
MNVSDELQKLEQLHKAGTINDAEFAEAKAKILRGQPGPAAPGAPADQEAETRKWSMFLHLSMLLACVTCGVGIIAPIVIWQIKKTELPGIDIHGKNATNWIISIIIYSFGAFFFLAVVSFVIPFLWFLSYPVGFAISVANIAFPIMAGVKANNGEVWQYPLSLQIIK